MLGSFVDWMLGCRSCAGCDNHNGQNEFQVHLSTDASDGRNMQHTITRSDSFDITFTPRSFNNTGDIGSRDATRAQQQLPKKSPITPRQRDLKSQLELPLLHTYPVPPSCSPEDVEEDRKAKLLEMYQEFALDLHTGMYLTQLTSNRDYSDIHCQLLEDMLTLKLDQSNGRIIEFPLTGVSKVYRIVKNEDKWYSATTPMPGSASGNTEHIVVVEFMRRKLAFVFKELQVSQRFLMCMELLIRRAQQKQAKKALRSLTPAFPSQGAGGTIATQQCPTPRQVHDAMARPGSSYFSGS